MARIRPARPDDIDRLYEICVRTADAGDDATPLHRDPRLPGHVWAAPYLRHAPEHAFVVAGEDDVAGGYVLGALDSRAFEAALEASWWPELRERYPLGHGDRTAADERTVERIHRPPVAAEAVLDAGYPSHLHIDLLPAFQGRGWGRRLLDALFDSLATAGSAGVHLGVARRNERAIRFYRAVGFTELGAGADSLAFGRRLTPR